MSSSRISIFMALGTAMSAVLMSVSTAHATMVSGKYFEVDVDSINLPSQLWDSSIVDSLDGASTSLIIKPRVDGVVPNGVWAQFFSLSNLVIHAPQEHLNADSGAVEQVRATLADWTLQTAGTFTAPSDASFKTAYGFNQLTLTGVLGVLAESPVLAVKPLEGSQILTVKERTDISVDDYEQFSEGVRGNVLKVRHSVYTPYYALPSLIDPRCASLSCMQFKEGSYTTPTYTLTLRLNATPAVPEPQTWAMALVGLGIGAAGSRYRRDRKA